MGKLGSICLAWSGGKVEVEIGRDSFKEEGILFLREDETVGVVVCLYLRINRSVVSVRRLRLGGGIIGNG